MIKTIIITSISIVLCLTGYFLGMDAFGLSHNFYLRLLNALFMASGIFMAIREVGLKTNDRFDYFNGAATGFTISILVSVTFAIIMSIYLSINSELMKEIQAVEPQGEYLTVLGVSLLIFIEGIASGILFTYASLQFLKSKETKLTN